MYIQIISVVLATVFLLISSSDWQRAEARLRNDDDEREQIQRCFLRSMRCSSEIQEFVGMNTPEEFLEVFRTHTVGDMCSHAKLYFTCGIEQLDSGDCSHFHEIERMKYDYKNLESLRDAFCSDTADLEKYADCVTQDKVFRGIFHCAGKHLKFDNCHRIEMFWNCLKKTAGKECGRDVETFVASTWEKFNELQPRCLGAAQSHKGTFMKRVQRSSLI